VNIIINKLLQFGSKIIENCDDDQIKPLLLDTDFKDRTVLNLITSNGFEPLFTDPKIDILLDEIWVGENSYQCDGRLHDFSILTF